jgi:hypothetical protein
MAPAEPMRASGFPLIAINAKLENTLGLAGNFVPHAQPVSTPSPVLASACGAGPAPTPQQREARPVSSARPANMLDPTSTPTEGRHAATPASQDPTPCRALGHVQLVPRASLPRPRQQQRARPVPRAPTPLDSARRPALYPP